MVGPRFVGRSLSEFVREIYVVVLALGFAGFANSFLSQLFDAGQFHVAQLTFFLAIYYFFAYDWLAYGVLMDEYPYQIRVDAPLSGQGRFYADLLALLLKALLVYLTTNPFTESDVFVAAAVLAGWHTAILVWYGFAVVEYDVGRLWPTHLLMVSFYGVYAVLAWALVPRHPAGVEIGVVGLAVVVVVYANRRKQELIEGLAADAGSGTEGSAGADTSGTTGN